MDGLVYMEYHTKRIFWHDKGDWKLLPSYPSKLNPCEMVSTENKIFMIPCGDIEISEGYFVCGPFESSKDFYMLDLTKEEKLWEKRCDMLTCKVTTICAVAHHGLIYVIPQVTHQSLDDGEDKSDSLEDENDRIDSQKKDIIKEKLQTLGLTWRDEWIDEYQMCEVYDIEKNQWSAINTEGFITEGDSSYLLGELFMVSDKLLAWILAKPSKVYNVERGGMWKEIGRDDEEYLNFIVTKAADMQFDKHAEYCFDDWNIRRRERIAFETRGMGSGEHSIADDFIVLEARNKAYALVTGRIYEGTLDVENGTVYWQVVPIPCRIGRLQYAG